MNNYKVGIYLRISKEDERLGESGSITNQRSILMDYINKNNYTYIDEYVDDGVSGSTFDRVGFKNMLNDIKNKKINMVITKDTSRLGRDHIEFGYYVEKFFPEHNVRYVAVCDNIDTFSNNNDMLLFKSAYNDLYIKDISNKIRSSLNIKKRNGEFVGAYAPYGYNKDINNKHKLVIDEESAKVVRRIFNLFVSGNSMSSIANTLTKEGVPIPSIKKNMNRGLKSSIFGIWNVSTIRDILTNPTYIGNLTQGRNKKINYKSKKRIHVKKDDWIITNNTCPSIIDKNIFELANTLYNSNKNNSIVSNDLLLKGLVYCNECNHKIGFRKVNKDKIYGSCNYYLKHRIYNVCTPHNIKYNILEDIVIEEISKLLNNMDCLYLKRKLENIEYKKYFSNYEKKAINIKKELGLIELKIERLYDDRLSGIIDKEIYLKNCTKLKKEECILKNKLDKINDVKSDSNDLSDIFDIFIKNIKYDKRFISQIIDRINYSDDKKIYIYFKIKNCNF